MGDGKSSPFNSDGKSGADGNGAGGKMAGIKDHRGVDRPQKMGAGDFNPDSVAPGGRTLKLDPPGDREGLIGQDVKGMKGGKPFKLGGKGPSMPSENAGPDEGGPVGDLPAPDTEAGDGHLD